MAIDTDYVQQMATQLAQYDVQAALSKANRNEQNYQSKLTAVTKLESAIKTFASAVKSLKPIGTSVSSVLTNKATFSSPDYATASVSSKAVPGSYDFFVGQLASRHQVAFEDLQDSDIASTTGVLKISQNGTDFDIDLDGIESLQDLATAINAASDNTGVNATLVRSDGKVSLVMASEKTGTSNAISLDTSALGDGALKTALGAGTELSAAKDAEVYLGGEGGMKLTSTSNTFDNIVDGVSMTFTKAHQSGEAPVNMSIEQDKSATQEKTQKLLSAFNTLTNTISELTASGVNGSARGMLAGDSSIRAIESMLNQALRANYGGATLMDYGVAASRTGGLSIDSSRFTNALAANPDGLEKLFADKGGLIETLEKNLNVYTSSAGGVFANRKESLNASLKKVNVEFDRIQDKYDNYYNRYLKQYTNMMQIMSSMQQTSGLFF